MTTYNPHSHNMSLNDPWFTYVKKGEKKYEGRKFKNHLKIGDVIQFHHHTDSTQPPFLKKIKNILNFSTFEEALKKLPLSDILPHVATIEEGIEIYYRFVSLPTQLQHGVIMIELE